MSTDLTLSDAIMAMVAQKRALGYKYLSEAAILQRFLAFSRSQFPGLNTITRDSADAWVTEAQQRSVKPSTLSGLTTSVRDLARWLIRHGVAAYILPTGLGPRPSPYLPHIYTDQELMDFFAQTDLCHVCPKVPVRHLVMPVFFRTLYACGLRCSEARLLRASDVDLATGVLHIRDAKGGKDRQIPISESLRVRLTQYYAQIDWIGNEWFFPGRDGRPLTLTNVYRNFRRFLWQARISHGGRGKGPRVHDLRHTFAVNNLRRWFAVDKDAGALLPILQTYMGHDSINDTAYYLRLTAESHPDIVARLNQALGHIVPIATGGADHAN